MVTLRLGGRGSRFSIRRYAQCYDEGGGVLLYVTRNGEFLKLYHVTAVGGNFSSLNALFSLLYIRIFVVSKQKLTETKGLLQRLHNNLLYLNKHILYKIQMVTFVVTHIVTLGGRGLRFLIRRYGQRYCQGGGGKNLIFCVTVTANFL